MIIKDLSHIFNELSKTDSILACELEKNDDSVLRGIDNSLIMIISPCAHALMRTAHALPRTRIVLLSVIRRITTAYSLK